MRIGRDGNAKLPWLTFLFLTILILPAVMLVFLGLRLLEQDRIIGSQRVIERREAAADRVARTLDLALSELEQQAHSGLAPKGMVRLDVTSTGVEIQPACAAAWLPKQPLLAEAEANVFQDAEAEEFRAGGGKALSVYEAHSQSSSARVRAGALIRLARVHRRAGRIDLAAAEYGELSRIGGISFENTPADLLARKALCDLFEESGRLTELEREAEALRKDLLSGRWQLDYAGWTLAAEQVESWTGSPSEPAAENLLVSQVAEWLWRECQQDANDGLGRWQSRTFCQGTTGLTLLWYRSAETATGVAILPELLGAWADKAAASANDPGSRLTLLANDGLTLYGARAENGPGTARRSLQETGLPWVLLMSPSLEAPSDGEYAARRGLLMAGLAATLLLLAAGILLLWWTVRRELTVAQLQSDFVSAVSHDFRTPLTTMRHLTELLDEDDQIPREERKSFYGALIRSTSRLQRLVESLLDFARIERGKRAYDLRSLDANEFTSKVVEEFSREVEPAGFQVSLHTAGDKMLLEADSEALGHALWNLLDNAVKYSGDSRHVEVAVKNCGEQVVLSVTDRGLGIPAAERKTIFGKFVRGEHTRRLGIQGMGLGLAMAGHIVAGHRGRIEVKSAEGQGSEFSILLPRGG